MFRLKLGMGTESSGGGEWPLFTDRETFETALLNALLEVEARKSLYRNHSAQRIRSWVTRKLPKAIEKSGDLRSYGIRRVIAAEQFIDGEWVELRYRLTPPAIEVWQ